MYVARPNTRKDWFDYYFCWLMSLSVNELSVNNSNVFWIYSRKALSGFQSMFQLALKGRAFVFEAHSLCVRRINSRLFFSRFRFHVSPFLTTQCAMCFTDES